MDVILNEKYRGSRNSFPDEDLKARLPWLPCLDSNALQGLRVVLARSSHDNDQRRPAGAIESRRFDQTQGRLAFSSQGNDGDGCLQGVFNEQERCDLPQDGNMAEATEQCCCHQY